MSFHSEKWQQFDNNGIDMGFYTHREREKDEIFPWDLIDIGVTKGFLYREFQRAKQGKVTPNCKQACVNCGAKVYSSGVCNNEDCFADNIENLEVQDES